MKLLEDERLLRRHGADQGGVFSKGDLQTLLAERHPAAFGRRLRALQAHGILRRFTRGFYVAQGFDLTTLSQRIAPESCISFGTVLARALLIGANPERQVIATKVGRTRAYDRLGYRIEHVGIAPDLLFGYSTERGLRFANPEKAVLDVLYYHLRGRRYPFDIYSDINYGKLDRSLVTEYLTRYRNPKFVAFAARLLKLP